MASPLQIVVLVSGGGTNLQAIMDDALQYRGIEVVAVISNNPTAGGLDRAEKAGICSAVLDHRLYANRVEYDQALIPLIETFSPDLVVLAGFMRILSSEFVDFYHGRLLNIHPSLLPKYTGLRTHQRVIANHELLHGASVHFVTEALDGGPVILQASLTVIADESESDLAARVLALEHVIYPKVIHWFAEKRLSLQQQLWFDQQPLMKPLQLDELTI